MATFNNGVEALLSVGSADGNCIRVGVYERTGCVLPHRIGWFNLPLDSARVFLAELETQIDAMDAGRDGRCE